MQDFLSTLHNLLTQNICPETLQWAVDGKSFLIHNNHNLPFIINDHFPNFTLLTFFRKLRNYGFKKIKTNQWGNNLFIKEEFYNIYLIKEKNNLKKEIKIPINYSKQMIKLNEIICKEIIEIFKLFKYLINQLTIIINIICPKQYFVALILILRNDLLILILKKLNYKIYQSNDSKDFIKRFYEGNIELVVVDIEICSLEDILEIRRASSIKIIMIGYSVRQEQLDSYVYAGVNVYIERPFSEVKFMNEYKKIH